MGRNATATEQQGVLVPLQKPYPEAEEKMIPSDETTDKDASSSDHQNDFYGHPQLSLTESWLGWKSSEDNDSSLFSDKDEEMMGRNVAPTAEQ